MAFEQYSRGEQLALGGAAITAVGAFLPWIEASIMGLSESVTGVEGGDGWITLIAAVIVAVTVLAGSWGKLSRGVTVFFGLIIAAIGLMYISDPATGIEGSPVAEAALSPAIGLYVTALGGAMAVAGGIIGGDDTRDPQPATQSPGQRGQQPQSHQPQGQPQSRQSQVQQPEDSELGTSPRDETPQREQDPGRLQDPERPKSEEGDHQRDGEPDRSDG